MLDKQYPNGITMNQFAEIMIKNFGDVNSRLNNIETRLNTLEVKVDSLTNKITSLEYQIGVIEHRFDIFEERFDLFEQKLEKQAEWVRTSVHHLADIIEGEVGVKVLL